MRVTERKITRLPRHLAIVPDGNRRWAEQHGLTKIEGHRAGAKNTLRMVEYLNEYPIEYVTLYGFSTENWSRPGEEIEDIFQLLLEFLHSYVPEIHRKGIKLCHLGRLHELPKSLQLAIKGAAERTRENTGMTLNVAFNYGGRAEIVDAVRTIIAEGAKAEDIDEKLLNNHLYTAGIPEVDLLIRTGDELRLSNFLIWQTAYSEYHFTNVLWPDFGKEDIEKALLSYSQRERRFGGP